MHRVKSMSSYLLVVACLFLAGAGLLRAKWQAEGTKPVSSSTASESLNFEFFKTKVQPIFLRKRPGHARCVSCHGSPTAPAVFRLQPLSAGSGAWDEEQSRKNFEVVKKLVVPGDLNSPLLMHPLAEQAGGDFFHNGGKHFDSQNDPEWQTLKAFVFGGAAR
jgi:hypothetical protein